jgi:hypothetical protein
MRARAPANQRERLRDSRGAQQPGASLASRQNRSQTASAGARRRKVPALPGDVADFHPFAPDEAEKVIASAEGGSSR